MITKAQMVAELLARRRALESLAGFRDYLAPSGHADVVHPPAAHHVLLCEKLDASLDGYGYHRAIVMPPGAAKSTYSSVQAPLYAAARKPNQKIICVSSTASIANEFASRRRSLSQSEEFKRLGVPPINDSLENLQLANGSGIRALGAGATVTGLRADLLIADDLVASAEEAASPDRLSALWEWWVRELRTRLKPGGKIFLIGTRWSTRDPLGRVLAENEQAVEKFDLLHFPLICLSENDPLGRKPGDVLWPEWFTPAFVATAQQDPATFSVLYQGRPRDAEGVWCEPENIIVVDAAPEEGDRIAAVDIALSEPGKGDRTARVAATVGTDRCLYITHVETEQSSKPDKTARSLLAFSNRHEAAVTYVDDDNASRSWQALTAEIGKTEGTRPINLHMLPLGGKSKEIRAAAIQGLFASKRVKFVRAAWNAETIEEILNFPGGHRDDIVDCLSLLGRAMQRHMPADAFQEPAKRPAQITDEDGRQLMNVSLDDLWRDRALYTTRRRTRI